MGTYFSAPNPDVDSRAWIETLRRLLELDIEILVEGHGHVHTLRPEIPESCPLVVRRDPRQALHEKLQFCEWLRDQIDAGIAEGLALQRDRSDLLSLGAAIFVGELLERRIDSRVQPRPLVAERTGSEFCPPRGINGGPACCLRGSHVSSLRVTREQLRQH